MSLSELMDHDIIDEGTRDKFRDFFKEMDYGDRIEKIEEKPGNSLDVDMDDVKEYDSTLYKDIVEVPEYHIYNAEEALREYYPHVENIDNTSLRFYNLENPMMVSEIRENDIGDLVELEGLVNKATSVRVRTSVLHFKCTSCSWETDIVQDREQPKYPEQCGGEDCTVTSERKFKVIMDKSRKVNYKKIKLQEPPEKISGGENPQKIDVMVHGDLADKLKPGKRATMTGILKSKVYTKGVTRNGTLTSTSMDKFLLCTNIKTHNKDFEDLEMSDEDIKRIKEISRRKDLYDYLARSIAPSIEETLDEEKRALMLQLFSGDRKPADAGNSEIRGDIHILLVGDPGTGKSKVINYVGKITPRGVTTSGQGSTSAGLTATATKNDSEFGEEGNWTIEAGALPLSDKGIAVVDELDKMDKKDRSSMHEALESQTVSISKAGINTTLKSRCSLLAAANPEDGTYSDTLPVADQIDLEPPLISRFDLIFVIEDEVDEDKDKRIASAIMDTNVRGQKRKRGELDEDEPDILDLDMYRKYVAYARREINPVMTEEARDRLQEFYVTLRQSGSDDTISITARKLQALIRLSEASAKARLGDEITISDAERVIDIMRGSIKDVGINPDGELDSGRIYSNKSLEDRNKSIGFKEMFNIMIRDAKEQSDGAFRGVELEDVYEKAEKELDMEKEEVQEKLEKMDRRGVIIYPEGKGGGLVKKY